MSKKWNVIFTNANGEEFLTECANKEEAVDKAKAQWNHLTALEQKKCKVVAALVDENHDIWEIAIEFPKQDEA
jgi:hypothetical protein